MYEQLKDFLNKCIELWWKPKNSTWRYKDYISEIITDMDFYEYTELAHILFSKDSWIMEFVEWKETLHWFYPDLSRYYYSMSMLTAEEKIQFFLAHSKLPPQSDK